jgi:hypothetical protein
MAAIIMLLHAVGHTMGVLSWKKPEGHVPPELVKQMVDQRFEFMKADSSIAEFYDGFGYASTIALLLVFFLWVTAGITGTNAGIAKKILVPVLFFLVFLAIDELIFFFPFAASFTIISAVLVLISIFLLKKPGTP